MKIIRVVLAVVAISFLFIDVGVSRADTLNLVQVPVDQYGGFYVGYTGGNVNGSNTIAITDRFVCDDFVDHTYLPAHFPVFVSTLSDLSKTYFGSQTGSLFKYQQAAWLMSQFDTHPTDIGPIQYAIWKIFTPSTPDAAGLSDTWLTLSAAINPNDYDFSRFRIYTPTTLKADGSRDQEFLGLTPVPIPGAILLFGPGVAGLAAIRRRFKK